MRFLYFLLAWPLAAQVANIPNTTFPAVRGLINSNFVWLGANKAGIGACSSGYYVASIGASGVVCLLLPSGGGSMTYPGAGIGNSTGSAWGTSYTVGTGANNLVKLNGSGQLPAVSAALLTSWPTFNQDTTGKAAALAGGSTGQYPYQTGAGATGFRTPNVASGPVVLDGSGNAAVPGTVSAGDGTASSVMIWPELAANGGHDTRDYGADAQASSGCKVRAVGDSASGQVEMDSGSTVTMSDGKVCRVMTWQTPAGGGVTNPFTGLFHIVTSDGTPGFLVEQGSSTHDQWAGVGYANLATTGASQLQYGISGGTDHFFTGTTQGDMVFRGYTQDSTKRVFLGAGGVGFNSVGIVLNPGGRVDFPTVIEGSSPIPTVNVTSCTGASIYTGSTNTAGLITGLPSGACTIVLSFSFGGAYSGTTAAHDMNCMIANMTHPANVFTQTNFPSATSATFAGTSTSSDQLRYVCVGW